MDVSFTNPGTEIQSKKLFLTWLDLFILNFYS